MKIDEIQIVPVKPNNGLVAFASFVLNEQIYVGSVAIYTRLDGSLRLVWPTRKVGDKNISVVHPINGDIGAQIEAAVVEKYNFLMGSEVL